MQSRAVYSEWFDARGLEDLLRESFLYVYPASVDARV
jgi:hypothetical protein